MKYTTDSEKKYKYREFDYVHQTNIKKNIVSMFYLKENKRQLSSCQRGRLHCALFQFIEFSDDEEERRCKAKKRNKNKVGSGDGDTEGKRRPQNKKKQDDYQR